MRDYSRLGPGGQTLSPLKIIVILGPTATGKSALAVRLALTIKKTGQKTKTGGRGGAERGAEIISADSRQVYRGLDIGSGKITQAEMKSVPHHLLDIESPKKVFTVAQFQKAGQKAIKEIVSRGNVPIICGGTGFYIQALVDSVIFPEVPPNPSLRAKLEKKSTAKLCKILKKIDPRRFADIDPNNRHRLVRAIEIATKLGKVPRVSRAKSSYDPLFIGLTLPKEELARKIKRRLDARLEPKITPVDGAKTRNEIGGGMIEEVEDLRRSGLSWKRLESFGLEYRAVAEFLCLRNRHRNRHKNNSNNDDKKRVGEEIIKKEMTDRLEINIRQFAKRQMTWFKRDKRIRWFNPKEWVVIKKTVVTFLS